MATARENVTQEASVARSGQEPLIVVIEDNVAPTSEAAAGAMLADVGPAQVAGAVESQRLTRGANSRQEEEDKVAEVAPGLGGPMVQTVANFAAVAVPTQAGDDGMAKVKERNEKLNAENLALHRQLTA